MKNYIKSGAVALFVVAMTPILAFAQIYNASDTVAALTAGNTDLHTILVFQIGIVVLLVVALMGLGYGLRILRRHGTGRKF